MPANESIPTRRTFWTLEDSNVRFLRIRPAYRTLRYPGERRPQFEFKALRDADSAKVREAAPEICRRPRYPGRQHAAVKPPTDFFQTLTAS